MEHLIQKFKDEAFELLEELESSLLVLEESADDQENIGRVFRCLHTIKGSAAMFGFESVTAFTHDIEDVYELVRSNKMAVTKELIDSTLAAKDCIQEMLENPDLNYLQQDSKVIGLMAAFKNMLHPEQAAAAISSELDPVEAIINEEEPCIYRIFFKPYPDIFKFGTNPLFLLDELRELGEIRIVAQTDAIPALSEIHPEECLIYWDIILTTSKGPDAIKDVFIFVEDNCQLSIKPISFPSTFDSPEQQKKLGEILIDRGDLDADKIEEILHSQKKIGELLIEKDLLSKDKVISALSEQQQVNELHKRQVSKQQVTSLRVPLLKLDNLVNLVGELVTSGARLNELGNNSENEELRSLSEEVDRLISELRDSALNIRMMPIGSIFSKFNRLVRDLSQELGKKINFITEGEETELDKTVIEKLNDPLVHLIRNCVDHGIELVEARQKNGKNIEGRIRLTAAHSGAHVVIRIEDDGAGMNKDAILAKAVEKGLVSENSNLTDKDIYALIFLPGFSTAKAVTNVSGRGVGLDVVKKSIEDLRGTVEIESKTGQGTIISIKLPLTLAIIDGLQVKVANECYIIPLSIVEECVEFKNNGKNGSSSRHLIELRSEMLPYISIREFFSINGRKPDIEQIVVVQNNNARIGILVDEVIGQYQTVIKSLGKIYQNVEGLSGATLLGNGRVALILDMSNMEQIAGIEEKELINSHRN